MNNHKKCGVSTINSDKNKMKKLTTIIAIFFAIIFTSKAQVAATEQWYAIMDNDSSNHWSLIFEKDSEGNITTTGSWVYVYTSGGTTASDSNASGTVTINGTSCGFTVEGTASETTHSSTSPYSFSTTGVAYNGTASGTYKIRFTADYWPDSIVGTFAATKISGSGITAGSTRVNNTTLEKAIVIYPNPVADFIQVTGIDRIATFSLSDINGKLLLTKEVTAGETVSVGSLPNGLYLATIKSKGSTETKKLIIQR